MPCRASPAGSAAEAPSPPLRDFSEGSELGAQRPAREGKTAPGWALAPPPQQQPEAPETGGTGALSPVPGAPLLGAEEG